jgi:hypothetical protein
VVGLQLDIWVMWISKLNTNSSLLLLNLPFSLILVTLLKCFYRLLGYYDIKLSLKEAFLLQCNKNSLW